MKFDADERPKRAWRVHTFNTIQRTFVKQDTKVLQDDRELTSLTRNLFEATCCLGGSLKKPRVLDP